MINSLNRLLEACGELTELKIRATVMDTAALELPEGRLRKFSLCLMGPNADEKGVEIKELLTTENIERLAGGGSLRALKLHSWRANNTAPANSLTCLSSFASLSQLNIPVTRTNAGSLASVLAQLPHLRALKMEELVESTPFVDWAEVLRVVASNRPELVHLTLQTERPLLAGAVAAGKDNVLLRLENLVSLVLVSYFQSPEKQITWERLGELADRGRLEHLVIDVVMDIYAESHMSVEIMCRVIEKCKARPSLLDVPPRLISSIFQRLRYFKAGKSRFDHDECSKLASAASSTSEDTQGGLHQGALLHIFGERIGSVLSHSLINARTCLK